MINRAETTQKKRKIAFIGQKGIPAKWGGVERVTEELAVRTVKAGFDVAYCRKWYTENTEEQFSGVKLVYLPSIKTKHLDTITHTFLSVLHAIFTGVDIFHFQGVGPALLAWMPRLLKPKARVLVTFHCLDRRLQKWGLIARIAFWFGEFITMKCAHEISTTSRFLQDYCYQVWSKKTTHIPNGTFDSNESAPDIKTISKFGLKPFRYFISVGRIMKDKAQYETVQAFILAKQKLGNEFSDLKLCIIGESQDNDKYFDLVKQSAGNNTDIIFVGNQSGEDLKALMAFARGAIQPSYSEGMPVAVLEISTFGVPIIVSDIPAHKEIFGDAYNYVDVGNVEQLCTHIEKTAKFYDEIKMVAQAHSARIADHYRWEVISARYIVSLISQRFSESVA